MYLMLEDIYEAVFRRTEFIVPKSLPKKLHDFFSQKKAELSAPPIFSFWVCCFHYSWIL